MTVNVRSELFTSIIYEKVSWRDVAIACQYKNNKHSRANILQDTHEPEIIEQKDTRPTFSPYTLVIENWMRSFIITQICILLYNICAKSIMDFAGNQLNQPLDREIERVLHIHVVNLAAIYFNIFLY